MRITLAMNQGKMPIDKFLQCLVVQGDRTATSLAKGIVIL